MEDGNIRAYDPGKTVCDLFRLRAKTGEVVKEVVKMLDLIYNLIPESKQATIRRLPPYCEIVF